MAGQTTTANAAAPLGLPEVPVPADNPRSPAKIELGKQLFFDRRLSAGGSVSCASCHQPEKAFTDGRPTAVGIAGQVADIGKFHTPTLRNVALTGPYMHDGSQKSLEEVVNHYDQGGEQNPFLDPAIYPLHLTKQEKADLVAFLKALSNPACLFSPGRFPRVGEN